MQQQQQHANYDLLAVFTDETKADAAAAKLRKEGFNEDEVHQMEAGATATGQFREHGPNQTRQEFFLQTKRTGPNPLVVALLALLGGLLLGGITFAATFALPIIPEPTGVIIGVVVGLLLGGLIGLLRRGRVQGAIGQERLRTPTPPPSTQGGRTVVALRFSDPDNISRKSRARAILLNNQGKIDRSVGQ
ncbi:MAG TPA: hypothetical protein VKR06_21205 [Ktedonosporobacter sp.]|nr:hypothetical protein [Ktedonosporobacter sp.]